MRPAYLAGAVITFVALLTTVGLLSWKGYIPTPWTATEQAQRASSLAPNDWLRYTTEIWSIAFPPDWQASAESAESVVFASNNDVEHARLTVVESDESFVAIKKNYETDGLVFRSTEISLANYSAVKFEYGSGRVDYVIDYPSRVVLLMTDFPDSNEVGIMLATFGFLK